MRGKPVHSEPAPERNTAELRHALHLATIERDARITARQDREQADLERGNLNQLCFNDPPPGYSALDRKQGRIA